MTQKENAQPRNAELSATNNSANSTSPTKLTPRQQRALVALMERGAVPCKELGLLAGQNNFAELCAGLRRKLGYDAIDTGTIEGAVDRDGQPCKPGYYALSPQGRARAVTLLGGAHHA